MNRPSPDVRPFEKLRIVLAVLLVGSLMGASALRSFGLLLDDIYWLQENLGGDKVVHIMMGAALMASGLLMVVPKSFGSVGALLLVVLALLSLEELAQIISKTRELDFFDVVAGYMGASLLALAFTAGLYLRRYVAQYRVRHNEPAPSE